jgi:hypothetical protein
MSDRRSQQTTQETECTMIDKNRIIEPLPFKGPENDRRRHTRWALVRACKLRRASSLAFEAARTRDVSPSGARLVTIGNKQYTVGDRIELAVAWSDEAVVNQDSLIVGRIVRTSPAESGQTLAIEFENPMSIDASVLDPAA